MIRDVLIVGNGMAGARLAEELRARRADPDRLRVTVVGAEPTPAYNRVLLTGVLAGALHPARTFLYPPSWPADHHVTVHTGLSAVALDPSARSVTLADGRVLRADAVVLATGGRPRLPAVPGLAGPDRAPADGVAVLRTLSDCDRMLAAAGDGPVAVLGGGVLGLEAARALAVRGLPVTVLHPTGHLMNRQLDSEAGAVLAAALRRLGVRVRLGEAAARWDPARGLTTDAGRLVRCRAVLVAAGATADTALAAAAGLPDTAGGIPIDDRLRTAAPGVHAIGDCARHPGAAAGFVQPAWEQAAVLADLLTGADPAARYRGTRPVTRLDDDRIHLTALGGTDPDRHDDEVVRVSDPARGRYAKLVVRRDRVAAAILLGVPDAAARVVQLFDADDPVPADRLAVLLGRAHPDAAAETAGTVCHCNGVRREQLVAAHRAGATDPPALAAATRAGTGCGRCIPAVARLCDQLRDQLRDRLDPADNVA